MSFFITAYAWKSPVHADMISKGIEILKNDGFDKEYAFYAQHRDIMTQAVQKPDRQNDMDKGKGYHYYNAKNVDGRAQKLSAAGYYRRGNNLFASPSYTRSARTIFEDNYQLALSFYAIGGKSDISTSLEYAARCVHMISDICCTAHTTDLTLTSKYAGRHKRFEFRANDVYSKYTALHCDNDIYGEYLSSKTLGENFALIAEVSASFYDTVVHSELDLELDSVIEQLILLAQKHTAAFLLRFYNDIHSENNAIVPTETYRLINVAHSAALMHYGFGSGLATSPYQMEREVFGVRFSVSRFGYYEMYFVQSGERVTLAKSKSVRERPYGFKIAKTPLGYRLLSSLSGYTKALAANTIGDVGMAVYDPDNKAHHWQIERVK